MTNVPSYTKVFTLGSVGTERALLGEVIVQEKVDGSQFVFGIDEHGEVGCRSHRQQLVMDYPEGMFKEAVEYVQRIAPKLAFLNGPIWFYCEYLQKPKHNTLKYNRTPTNHLVLFDVLDVSSGTELWGTRDDVENMACYLEIDAIPEVHTGIVMPALVVGERGESAFHLKISAYPRIRARAS